MPKKQHNEEITRKVVMSGRVIDQRTMDVFQELYDIANSFSHDDEKGLDNPGIEH